jgi:chromosomal replication initiation ATPase DnaA
VTAEAALRDPMRSAKLLTADEFLRRLSTAVSGGTPELLLDELARASLIVIDDVHILDRHATAQEALLSARVACARRGEATRADERRCRGRERARHRIVHRFRTGHSATLGVPDWAHRVAILHAKAATSASSSRRAWRTTSHPSVREACASSRAV